MQVRGWCDLHVHSRGVLRRMYCNCALSSTSSWMRGRLMVLLMCVLCGAGLELVWTRHIEQVIAAARGGPGWTAAQYLWTVDQLLKSENNAVLMDALEVALGKDGPGAVQAMVQAGLLGVRPPSRACLHAPDFIQMNALSI